MKRMVGFLVAMLSLCASYAVVAIIWSLSFVFLRVLVPVLGPMWTATLRVLIAGTALVAWFALTRIHSGVRRHWRAYLLSPKLL